MGIIYAFWETDVDLRHQAELCALWRRSWLGAGWTPRVLRKTKKAPAGRPVVTFSHINFSCPPGRMLEACPFGAPGWRTAEVVLFPPEATPQQILDCGRPLPHAS